MERRTGTIDDLQRVVKDAFIIKMSRRLPHNTPQLEPWGVFHNQFPKIYLYFFPKMAFTTLKWWKKDRIANSAEHFVSACQAKIKVRSKLWFRVRVTVIPNSNPNLNPSLDPPLILGESAV